MTDYSVFRTNRVWRWNNTWLPTTADTALLSWLGIPSAVLDNGEAL
jgi:hypothetical protein